MVTGSLRREKKQISFQTFFTVLLSTENISRLYLVKDLPKSGILDYLKRILLSSVFILKKIIRDFF